VISIQKGGTQTTLTVAVTPESGINRCRGIGRALFPDAESIGRAADAASATL